MRFNATLLSALLLSAHSIALAKSPAAASGAAAAAAATQGSTASPSGIDAAIENFLMNNPEVIEKALIRLQEKRDQEAKEKAQKAIVEHMQDLYNDPQTPFMGNPKGKKALVLFADPNCSHCRSFHKILETAVQKDPEIKVIFKDIAILGPGSALAVHLALAAHAQGKYNAFQAEMMKRPMAKSMEDLQKIADAAGVDVNRAKADMDSEAIKKTFNDNWELAAKLGIEATPSFVVGQELYNGGMGLEDLMQLFAAPAQPTTQSEAKSPAKS
ncbi:MAG: thioredoxin domain-containing protein [Holosporales bacterium]